MGLKHIAVSISFIALMGIAFAATQSDEHLVNQKETMADNEYVLSDVSAFLLQGPLKHAESLYYSIPVEALEMASLEDEKLKPYLSYSREVNFDEHKMGSRVVLEGYDEGEVQVIVYRQATPYRHNERIITSVILFGDAILDSGAYNRAVLNQEFTTASQNWEKNKSITRINQKEEWLRMMEEEPKQVIITETYDNQQRLMTSERIDRDGDEFLEYLYLTFDEYLKLDLAKVRATNIEVSATLEDIQDYTPQDFIALDKRVSLFVPEEIDLEGNARIAWRYDSKAVTKRVSKFTYY